MSSVENLIVETLRKIQAEQAAAKERDVLIIQRLGQIETGIARIAR